MKITDRFKYYILMPHYQKSYGSFEKYSNRRKTYKRMDKKVMPLVNVSEDEENYQIDVLIPGIKKENIKVTYEGKCLNISYEQGHSDEYKEKYYHRKEFQYEDFMRSFTIPRDVNIERISSEHKGGILVILLPKMKMLEKNIP